MTDTPNPKDDQNSSEAGKGHRAIPPGQPLKDKLSDAAPSFTPGPWFNNAGVSIDSVKGKTIVWLDEDTTEADAALIIAAPELYEALKTITMKGCRVIHGSFPKGTTCLDKQGFARVNRTPYRFAAEFRAQILNGEHLCDGCVARAALALANGQVTSNALHRKDR